jgi:hypothetical protein
LEDAAGLVVADYGFGLGAVLGEAVGEGGEAVICAAGEAGAAAGAGIGGKGDVEAGAEDAAACAADEAVGYAVADDGLIDKDEDGEIDGSVLLAEHDLEGICLADGAGVAIENPCAVMGGEPLADDLDGDLVRDQEAALEILGGAEADECASGFLLAEHRADRGGEEAEAFFQELRLRALAGSRRSEQHEATMHEPGCLPVVGGDEEA